MEGFGVLACIRIWYQELG